MPWHSKYSLHQFQQVGYQDRLKHQQQFFRPRLRLKDILIWTTNFIGTALIVLKSSISNFDLPTIRQHFLSRLVFFKFSWIIVTSWRSWFSSAKTCWIRLCWTARFWNWLLICCLLQANADDFLKSLSLWNPMGLGFQVYKLPVWTLPKLFSINF